MSKKEAADKLRGAIDSAVRDAIWNGLTEAEVAAILAGAAVR